MTTKKEEYVINDNQNMTGSRHVLVDTNQIVFHEGGFLKRKTKLEKILLVCLGIAVLIALILMIVLIVKNQSKKETKICMTEDCVKTAAMISEAIDYSVNPCDDFYEFSCGQWKKKHVIPEDKTSYGIIDQLFQYVELALKNSLERKILPGEVPALAKAKTLYASCMNTSAIASRGVAPLKSFLQKFGGWPVISGTWSDSSFDLVNALVQMTLYNSFKWDVTPLFEMDIKVDSKDSTKHVIELSEPSFGMPGRKYYLKGRDDKMVKAYEDLAVNIAIELGANISEAQTDIKDMVDFEIQLANITTSLENRRDSEARYNKMSISQLQQLYGNFDWVSYFHQLFSVKNVHMNITSKHYVINTAPTYFSQLSNLIGNTSKRVLANYICWRIVKNHISDLTEKLQDLLNDYNRVVIGTSTSQPKWLQCATYTRSAMMMATGRLFVDSTFDKDSKTIILDMIDKLRWAFNKQVEESTWMDEATKKVAKEKADAMGEQVGYPDEILDNQYLNDLYKHFEFKENEYFENKLNSEYQLTIEKLNKLTKPADKKEWSLGPAFVNANYGKKTNYMEFPAAFLQPRYYSRTYPKSVNYGGVGMVIGHEITHGFDDQGRQYDKDGNLRQWWPDDVINNFKEKAQCIIDQYSAYTVPELGLNVNGINTQGENIADIGGLKQSFQAYRKWIKDRGEEEPLLPGLTFNNDQIFFISFAQTFCGNMRSEEAKQRILNEYHSPDKFRVIGSCQNSEDFARVFNCPKNSYMNPPKKCSVW